MTTTQVVEHHIGPDNIDIARRTLTWLRDEARSRSVRRHGRAEATEPDFDPIRVVVDSELQFDGMTMRFINNAAVELGSVPFEPAHPTPGASIGIEFILRHEPSALAASNPKHPDAPDLWLANLRCELRGAVVEGWLQLDPPWPGVTQWQRWRANWQATRS